MSIDHYVAFYRNELGMFRPMRESNNRNRAQFSTAADALAAIKVKPWITAGQVFAIMDDGSRSQLPVITYTK